MCGQWEFNVWYIMGSSYIRHQMVFVAKESAWRKRTRVIKDMESSS